MLGIVDCCWIFFSVVEYCWVLLGICIIKISQKNSGKNSNPFSPHIIITIITITIIIIIIVVIIIIIIIVIAANYRLMVSCAVRLHYQKGNFGSFLDYSHNLQHISIYSTQSTDLIHQIFSICTPPCLSNRAWLWSFLQSDGIGNFFFRVPLAPMVFPSPWLNHHHWMSFDRLIIDFNGFSMLFLAQPHSVTTVTTVTME